MTDLPDDWVRRFTFRLDAHEDDRFGPAVFDHMVGKVVPLMVFDGTIRDALIVAASIAGDGRSADITIEVDTRPVELRLIE